MNISSNLFIRRAIRFVAGLLINAGALAASASIASAAVITVTTGLDEFDTTPNATCSLREAIQSANTDGDFGGCTGSGIYGNDTIVFYGPAGATDNYHWLDKQRRQLSSSTWTSWTRARYYRTT
jgi:CSLREA domain-containing protein